MIKSTELSKKYGGVTVLNIPSLEIPKGQSFGLVETMALEKQPILIYC